MGMTGEQICRVGPITIGDDHPLTIIAGPCVLEDPATNRAIAGHMSQVCRELGLQYIFKASFDKANRSSIESHRGPGPEKGVEELRAISAEYEVLTTTDIHDPEHAGMCAEHVDLLQIPAFLCRQTDLLSAAAATGRPLNIKKGQFLSPAEMRHVIDKVRRGGCTEMLLTERGSFFGYHRLVNDFIGLGDLMELGPPVCFDVTHSTQLPGADSHTTAGRPERAGLLARAAAAAGVPALFIECHPDPPRARSDASTVQPLDSMADLLITVKAIRSAACGQVLH